MELSALAGAGAMLFPSCITKNNKEIPLYLSDYKELYKTNPRKVSLE